MVIHIKRGNMNHTSMMRYLPVVESAGIEAALAVWQSRFPNLGVFAMLPEAEQECVSVLQSVCALCNVPLLGAIFPALVKDGEFLNQGVWLLGMAEMPYYALHENLPAGREEAECAAETIAAAVREKINHIPDLTLFLLFDAMLPSIGTILDSLYLNLANRVHYAGANAGCETFQPMPCLFDSQRLVQHGVLLMLLKNHRGAIVEHGYCAPQHTVYATSTEGNRISHIDWRPAFTVYQELVRAQYGVEITPDNFYSLAVHYPFGIVRANHHVVVRIPVSLAEDGSLYCVGEVPPDAVLTLLECPEVDTHETLRVLLEGLSELDGGPAGQELLLFYCAGRRMHLGLEQATRELGEFAAGAQAAQVAGALSLGEIGGSTLHGYPLFHNAALIVMRWKGGRDE